MAEFIPISQVKKMRSGINAKAEVKSKGDPRTVNLKSGGTVDVCDAIIADGETEDDQMKLTLWGDDIKAVNVGDVVIERIGSNDGKQCHRHKHDIPGQTQDPGKGLDAQQSCGQQQQLGN